MHIKIHYLRLLFLAVCALAVPVDAASHYTIKEEQVEVTTIIRVSARAKSSTPVRNKMYWPPYKWVIPDGSIVKKGDKIVEFRDTFVKSEIEDLSFEIHKESITFEKSELDVTHTISDAQGEIDELNARKKVLEAKLVRYRSLPRPEDVRIAQGRFEIAEREYKAARDELDRDTERLKKGFISHSSLEKSKRDEAIAKTKREYAEANYRVAKLKVSPEEIKIVELQIANLDLEIQQQNRELAQKKSLIDLERKSTRKKLDRLKERQDRKRKELAHVILKSPADGVAMYTPRLRRHLSDGGKPSFDEAILEIPDLSSLILEGHVSGRLRAFFTEGDQVEVRFNANSSYAYKASITKLSLNPVDLAETSDEWGEGKNTGIKVFPVEIELAETSPYLRPGVFAHATIVARKPHRGPAIPLEYVRYRKGKSWVSVDGVYEEVTGLPLGEYFILSDREERSAQEWVGRKISQEGIFPDEKREHTVDAYKNEDKNHIVLTGELVPLKSVQVSVPRQKYYYRYTIGSAIEDGLEVQKGDVLVRLLEEGIDRNISNAEEKVITTKEKLESQKRTLALKKQERDFKVATAKNNLEIARLKLHLTELGGSSDTIRQSKMGLQQARIEEQFLKATLERSEQQEGMMSPQGLLDMQRNYKRAQLRREEAQLSYNEQIKVDEIKLSQDRVAYLEAKIAYENTVAQYDDAVVMQETTLKWRERDYSISQRELQEHVQSREELTIKAPSAGIFKVARAWDGIGLSKIKQGMGVWRQSPLGELVDNSQMYVRLLVPERLYTRVARGVELQVRIPSLSDKLLFGTISEIEPFFEDRLRPDGQSDGMYGTKGSLGETVFPIRVTISSDIQLKPGVVAQVFFPLGKEL